jgi:transcriptional regulator with XRE-family HTH domain
MRFMEHTSRTFRLRSALGEPQHIFGKRIGCSQATVARLEQGQPETGPQSLLLDQIEAALDQPASPPVSPGALLHAPLAASSGSKTGLSPFGLPEAGPHPDDAAFSSPPAMEPAP